MKRRILVFSAKVGEVIPSLIKVSILNNGLKPQHLALKR